MVTKREPSAAEAVEVEQLLADAHRRLTTRDTVTASETEYQATIVRAAQWSGWRVLGILPAMRQSGKISTPIQGHNGYPDLTLVHDLAHKIIWVEIKKRPNQLETEQKRWRDAIEAAGGEWHLVWVPEELDSFCQWLVETGKTA